MNELKWLRLYTEIIDDEKIRLIAFEDRWHYVAILCLKQSGVIDSENPELKQRKMAIKLGLSLSELDSLNKRLSDVELIQPDWCPVGWYDRQFLSDSSTERVRKHREKQKKEPMKRDCNVSVTAQETETETEKKKNSDSAPQKSRCPYTEIISLYHEKLPSLPKLAKLTDRRKTQLRKLWLDDLSDLEYWGHFFDHVDKSDFLMGRTEPMNGHKHFRANLEWITIPGNYVKIYEDFYHEQV